MINSWQQRQRSCGGGQTVHYIKATHTSTHKLHAFNSVTCACRSCAGFHDGSMITTLQNSQRCSAQLTARS